MNTDTEPAEKQDAMVMAMQVVESAVAVGLVSKMYPSKTR